MCQNEDMIDIERLIHSIKTAIACAIGFLFAEIIGFPTGSRWIVISTVVVMCAQIYVGSVTQKAYARFLGTILGCLFAAIAITISNDSSLSTLITLGLSGFIFSYIATGQEIFALAGTLGAVTTIIIMLDPQPTLTLAAERFFEISIGVLIATVVSQFILPIHARTHLRRAQASTLEKIRNYYSLIMIIPTTQTEILDIPDLDEQIVKSLLKQRQLVKESSGEHQFASDADHFMQTFFCERDMLRSISWMYNALTYIRKTGKPFTALPSLQIFNEQLIQSLNTILKAIETNKPFHASIPIPSPSLIKKDLQEIIESSSHEELIYIDGFLFSAEMLTNAITKLSQLYRITRSP